MYTIFEGSVGNFLYLKKISRYSGGKFFNLNTNKSKLAQIAYQIGTQAVKYLGTRVPYMENIQTYPVENTRVGALPNISTCIKTTEKEFYNTMDVGYGYNFSNITSSINVYIDISTRNEEFYTNPHIFKLVSKSYVRKKIESLMLFDEVYCDIKLILARKQR